MYIFTEKKTKFFRKKKWKKVKKMFLHVPWIKSKTCQRFTGELYLKKAPCDRVMQKIKHTRTFPSDFQTPNFIIKKKNADARATLWLFKSDSRTRLWFMMMMI